MKAFLFGHGHARALARAFARRQNTKNIYGFEVVPFLLTGEKYTPNFLPAVPNNLSRDVSPAFQQQLQTELDGKTADFGIICAMDVRFQRLSMTQESEVDPSRYRPIARRRAQVDAAPMMAAIWNATEGLPTIVLPPPPPIADEAYMLAQDGAASKMINKHGVASLEQRVGLWQAYCTALERITADAPGAHFMKTPEEAFDGETLARQYWSEDALLANDTFGAVMLDNIAEMAEDLGLVTGDAP